MCANDGHDSQNTHLSIAHFTTRGADNCSSRLPLLLLSWAELVVEYRIEQQYRPAECSVQRMTYPHQFRTVAYVISFFEDLILEYGKQDASPGTTGIPSFQVLSESRHAFDSSGTSPTRSIQTQKLARGREIKTFSKHALDHH